VTAAGAALLAAALAAGVASGCRRPPRGLARDAGPPVDYVRRSFQSTLAGCTDPASGAPAPCVRIEVEYVDATRAPAALSAAVARFVRETVLRPLGEDSPPESAEALRDELYDSYRDLQRRFPDYHLPWVLRRNVTVACNTARVQGLAATEQSFTGGANEVERVEYRSFDTETGKRVGLDAFVAPENLPQLTAEVERRFREVRRIPAGQSLLDAGFYLPDGLVLTDNLLACPGALTFRWHRAEVAPGVFGATEVVIPRDDIRALLRADAP
jgi:hypothetical protein